MKRFRTVSPFLPKGGSSPRRDLNSTERISFKNLSLLESFSGTRVSLSKSSLNDTKRSSTRRTIILDSIDSKMFDFEETQEEHVKLGEGAPTTPRDALLKHGATLLAIERKELSEYSQVYYLALDVSRGWEPTEFNKGFDDEDGNYLIRVGDHIAFRYRILAFLGRGSFGTVVKVFDYKRSDYLALKILRNKKRFQRQATIEIKVLDYLRKQDSKDQQAIIKMRNYFIFRSHICITFELLSVSLYDFLRVNRFRGVSLRLIRRVSVQLLTALQFVHSNKIWHCDVKPENILLKKRNKSSIKLADFGSACFENEQLYSYIQSRFYRAPEVILKLKYDSKIDIWSVGCILAELLIGVPLFPGESEHHMLQRIAEILGEPPHHMQAACQHRNFYFNPDFTMILSADKKKRTRKPKSLPFSGALRCNDSQFLDFITNLLKWDPVERFSAEEALRHPWITGKMNLSFIEENFSKQARAKLSRSFRL